MTVTDAQPRAKQAHSWERAEPKWRPIPSSPRYFANAFGEIMGPSGRVLKTYTGFSGYPQVTTHIGGAQRVRVVYQMVCEAFHGPRPTSDHECAHADGVRSNSHAANLRWATRKENRDDMLLHGTRKFGEGHGRAQLKNADVEAIRSEYLATMGPNRARYGIRLKLSRQFGVSIHIIKDIVGNRSWVSSMSAPPAVRSEVGWLVDEAAE